jgi:hypothetical protein
MNIKIERIFLRELVLSIIIKYLLREIGFEFSNGILWEIRGIVLQIGFFKTERPLGIL